MSTATARTYRSRFAGRFMPAGTRKSPQNKIFYVPRTTYSEKEHCIKDSVFIDFVMANPSFNLKGWRAEDELTDDYR